MKQTKRIIGYTIIVLIILLDIVMTAYCTYKDITYLIMLLCLYVTLAALMISLLWLFDHIKFKAKYPFIFNNP